jgi:hypothetical protein
MPKRRSLAAKALASGRYRQRIKPDATKYKRRVKHEDKKHEDRSVD